MNFTAHLSRLILPGLLFLLFGTGNVYGQETERRDPVVWDIDFEGNDTFSNMILRDRIATEKPGLMDKLLGRTGDYLFREEEVRRDVIRLERHYQRRGFYSTTVDYIVSDLGREWKKRVTFHINEGIQTLINDVTITIDADDETVTTLEQSEEFTEARDGHGLQPGERYRSVRTAEVEGRFIQAMEEIGYAHAGASVEAAIDSLSNRASITITVNPGPMTYFDSFEVEGESTVDEAFIMRETSLNRGEAYSRSKMQQAQRELFNHHLFRFATINLPEQPADSTLSVVIRVREFPLRSVEAAIGFGREELIRGRLSWLHRNVFGAGHRFSVSGRASFIEQRLSMDYLFPYVFNTKSSIVSNPYGVHRVEPAYELFRAGFANSLIYQHSRYFTSSVSYELTVNEELSGRTSTALPDSVLTYNIASLTLNSYYSQRGPQSESGWVLQPSVEFSSLFSEGSYGFRKGTLDIRKYTKLTNSLVLAKRVLAGAIHTAVQDTLPRDTRYYSGGTNSVRGWNRQTLGPKRIQFNENGQFSSYVPTGGNAMFLFNIELRQELDFILNGLGIATFFDGGQVWRRLRDFNPLRISHVYGSYNSAATNDIQFGAGGGLSYESPIGPIRIDLGYKLNPTQEDLNMYRGETYGNPGRWTIHFSIGQSF